MSISRILQDIDRRLDQLEALSRIRYAKGAWTPVLAGDGTAGTFTYTGANTGGRYTRTGNRVSLYCRIRITAIGVAPTGNLTITGLPYTSATTGLATNGGGEFHMWQGITLPAGYTQLMLRILDSSTILYLTRAGSNVAQAVVQGGELALVGGLANFEFSGWYEV